MSPTSSPSAVYDHLMINFRQQPKSFTRIDANTSDTFDKRNKLSSSNFQSNCDPPLTMTQRKSIPHHEQAPPKRRYTITHTMALEPRVRCSVSNQVYERGIVRRPLIDSDVSIEQNETQVNTSEKTMFTKSTSFLSSSSTKIEPEKIDYRPLIINGRRRFTTLPSSSSMIIVKKKSPSPMHKNSSEQVSSIAISQ
jgi:hypothetical protein